MRLTKFDLDKLQHSWGKPDQGYRLCVGCNMRAAIGSELLQIAGDCQPAVRVADDGVIIRGPAS